MDYGLVVMTLLAFLWMMGRYAVGPLIVFGIVIFIINKIAGKKPRL